MKLVVGLGNPGKDYEFTRHNAGYLFADKFGFKKSGSFMNNSGTGIKKVAGNSDLTTLYIVHDDLDLKLGEYKIQFAKGPKDHNGILDIEEKLGTKDFWRVRIGIDNRNLENKTPGEQYVLQKFEPEELKILDSVFSKIQHDDRL